MADPAIRIHARRRRRHRAPAAARRHAARGRRRHRRRAWCRPGTRSPRARSPPGEPVRRYNQIIGIATQAIAPGQHVHTHNLAFSELRARPRARRRRAADRLRRRARHLRGHRARRRPRRHAQLHRRADHR
ncbi:MAG: SAF domain-containing protein [Comamonadaceae bacterium]|nr:SAF domain-containing protein [Comamonadaceae bacterium]